MRRTALETLALCSSISSSTINQFYEAFWYADWTKCEKDKFPIFYIYILSGIETVKRSEDDMIPDWIWKSRCTNTSSDVLSRSTALATHLWEPPWDFQKSRGESFYCESLKEISTAWGWTANWQWQELLVGLLEGLLGLLPSLWLPEATFYPDHILNFPPSWSSHFYPFSKDFQWLGPFAVTLATRGNSSSRSPLTLINPDISCSLIHSSR